MARRSWTAPAPRPWLARAGPFNASFWCQKVAKMRSNARFSRLTFSNSRLKTAHSSGPDPCPLAPHQRVWVSVFPSLASCPALPCGFRWRCPLLSRDQCIRPPIIGFACRQSARSGKLEAKIAGLEARIEEHVRPFEWAMTLGMTMSTRRAAWLTGRPIRAGRPMVSA